MKKYYRLFFLILLLTMSNASYADWMQDLFIQMLKANGINTNILDSENASLDVQRDILSSQKDIEGLMRDVKLSVTGHSGWGTYQFHDHQSYGDSARDWTQVMQMADLGKGDGHLGQMMTSIASQFPADNPTFNRGITDSKAQKYYALKSQTVLAARAASELDYNKIHEQIQYQHMLQEQIEKTADLKAAVDLSNRIQVEGNLIQLAVLRQLALMTQQQAITDQASVNAALSNAKFLTKE